MQRYIKIFYQKVKFNFFINYFLFIFAEIKYKTMKAKDKAKKLVNKYCALHFEQKKGGLIIIDLEKSKQCALIAVDQIIKVCPYISKNNCTSLEQVRADDIEFSEYWQEVKQEILKL